MSSPESGPELGVVCRNCGSEVSPYVTECPYCGHRLRKRAPRLEREGDEIRVRESRRRKRQKRRRRRERPLGGVAERPWATILLVLAPATLLVVQRAAELTVVDVGAIAGPVGSEWWRYLTASFAYDDIGYLFVGAMALGILVPPLERRLGSIPALLMALTGAVAGMLAAAWLSDLGLDDFLVAAGGNALALAALGAFVALRRTEIRERPDEEWDLIGIVTIAAVLLALPLVESSASAVAGFAALGAGLILGAIGGILGLASHE